MRTLTALHSSAAFIDREKSSFPLRAGGHAFQIGAVTLLLGLTFGVGASRLHAQASPIFVAVRTTQFGSGAPPTTAATATIAPPGPGWAYSAAAPVAGTTWNQILRPNPGIASGVGATAGTFTMNTANNIGLKNASGAVTDVKLTGLVIVGDTTGATRTEPATGGGGAGVLAPVGLMDGAWRIFSGANTTRFTFSGLPANQHYYLYCYGTSGASGCRFDVPPAYLAVGEVASKSTTGGNSGNLFVTDGTNYSLYAGPSVLWARFHTISDASGNLAITTIKNSANQQFFNGFQLMPFPLPVISLQPSATVSATVGGTVILSVNASGDGTLSYRWRKGGIPLDTVANPSAATSALTLGNVQAGDAGSYDVVITNDGGPITSSASVLSVGSGAVAPSISLSPSNQTAVVGGNVSFTVSANGTSPLTYTWQKSNDGSNFTDVANSNSVLLTRSSILTADAGYYRVVVTNSVGTVTSAAATLIVAPVIVSQPTGGTVGVGEGAALTAVVDVGAGAPVATTFVWKKNDVVVANGSGISGANTATLNLASMSSANSGVYTLTASNPAGAVTSAAVYLGVPTALSAALFPATNANGINPDTPPTIRFNGAPVVGTAGQIRVYDASNDAVVETIDLSTLTVKVGGVQTYRFASKTIGDRTYNYFPVVIVGNDARIALKSSTTLGYNKTYYVQMDPGVLLDSSGASFPGVKDKTTWRFTTKASGPSNTATAITVAADGSGDFTTLQGAIDLIPFSPANALARKITLKAGVYQEEINLRIGQNNIAIQGEGRGNTVIQYLNNNDLLPPGGAHFTGRAVFRAETNNLALSDLTVRNLTPQNGGQAEAIAISGTRGTFARCNFYSLQDTLFLNAQMFLTDCYVEGNTDFIWGGNALFLRCELRMVTPSWNSNPRNAAGQLGFIFVDSLFSRPSAAAVPDGTGFFSRDFGLATVMFALFNCRVDKHIASVGWSISATDLTALRYWEYNSKKIDGTPCDITGRPTLNHIGTGAPGALPVLDHSQVDAITAAYYSDPAVAIGFTPSVAPAIETQPTSQTVSAGATATLSAGVSLGFPAATVQWYKNGVAIDPIANPSATTHQLTIAQVQDSDVGVYTVVATNSAGSATSLAASLLISGHPPVILSHPINQVIAPGGTATFNVSAFGSGTLSYQWNFNGAPLSNGTAPDGTAIAGATSASLTVSHTQTAFDGSYAAVVSDSNGPSASNAATLIVGLAPIITAQPQNVSVTSGSSALFSVSVVDSSGAQYQWRRNGLSISGANAATFSIGGVTVADTGAYSVVITNRVGSTASSAAALSVTNFVLPNIPANNFSVLAFGALGDNATDNTTAIQNAINAAGAAGGGTVTIPAGTFLCGPIRLTSNTHLHLADGCVLKMLPMGLWPNAPYLTGSTPSFIVAENVHDVIVSGNGLIEGQGQAWWDRVDGTNGVTQQPTVRPGAAVTFQNVKNGAMIGFFVQNTPNINVQIGKDSRYCVISKVTITDPENSPNTDGIHLAGRDLLIDQCTVTNGDDNIVINTGTSGPETADIAITNCVLNTGHGCSIGSFTNASNFGIRNIRVDGLTFNGTSSGLTLKSSPGRGGVIRDLTYTNLVMNNVGSPFVVYSYYGTVGSAGATGSNRITPAVVASYNTTPPVPLSPASTLPEWKNISISNVTINNATNYSVLWGLPNKLVSGVTFTNITQNGGFGFEIYNAENIQFTGTNTFTLNSGQPLFTTYNANIIATQPQPQAQTVQGGGSATFNVTALGASGANATPLTYQWKLNGIPLANGVQADGTTVSGATTGALSLSNVSHAAAGGYTATISNLLDGYNAATSSLAPNTLPVSATSSAAVLTVLGPPSITVPPVSQSVNVGGSVSFTVTVTGTPTPTLAWYKDDVLLPGETSASLTISPAQAGDAGRYKVTATNAYGAVTSTPAAILTVTQSYAAWAAAHGLSPSNTAPAGDPEGDGVPNQIEYILGLDPLAPDAAGLPKVSLENGSFVFRLSHAKVSGDGFAVEQSSDLLSWTTVSPVVESSTATNETLLAALSPNETKKFVRLTSNGVSSTPLGYLKVIFPTGTTSAFGVPLDDTAAPIGLSAARIEAVTNTTLVHSAGGWTGNLANPVAPWAVRITSGAAAGKIFDISANTATTLTLSGASLSASGVVAGDAFELVSLDTLGKLFPPGTLQGGTSAASADVVQVRNGAAWIAFFYDTALGFWRRTSGGAVASDHTIIRPGSGLLVLRRAPTLTLTLTGRVLGTTFRMPINNASTSVLTAGFPMDMTLDDLAVQTRLAGWRAGTTTTAADSVGLYNGAAWVPYVFNGTHWQTPAGANSDALSIPAGGVLLIQRPGSAAGATDFIEAKPY